MTSKLNHEERTRRPASQMISANQWPDKTNKFRNCLRTVLSFVPLLGFTPSPSDRPTGISVIVRVKNEVPWIKTSMNSIRDLADEIVIADNGSTDGTIEAIESLRDTHELPIRLYKKPELDLCELSNFLLDQSQYHWIVRWDGDMVAHTNGQSAIHNLRKRLLALDQRRYYLIYLRHINLSGDLLHQDPKEQVHIEEYIHTYSKQVRYIHPRRYEALKLPKYYRVLFWYEPYSFHVNVKSARRNLLRYFWEDWMELKDYRKFPTLEDYVSEKIESAFGTTSWEEAEEICVRKTFQNHMRYNPKIFGPHPDLLKPHLESQKYKLIYKDGKIVGRDEN